jgi:hypothetical protein
VADDKADSTGEELIFDDRKNRRAKVDMTGAVAHSGELYPCRVLDLSAGGCRVEVDVDFSIGMPVHVDVGAHGRFPAVVIWVEGRTLGLGFAENVGQTLARLGPSAEALGLIGTGPDEDGDTGPARIIDPT